MDRETLLKALIDYDWPLESISHLSDEELASQLALEQELDEIDPFDLSMLALDNEDDL